MKAIEHFEQGNAAMHAGNTLLARAHYEQAIALAPEYGAAHFNLGATYQAQGLHHLALPHYERGVAQMDDPSIYLGNVLNTKMRICAWKGLDALAAQIEARVLAGQKTCPPFQIVSFSGSPTVQRKAAELWVDNDRARQQPANFLPRKKQAGKKIRIGYFSADFQSHPVAYLTAEMFELHDKTQFELIAFSNNLAQNNDPYRTRIQAAFDQFIDIHGMGGDQIVALARQMDLDVVVELTGLTQGGLIHVLMARVAPVQIQYLGYSATTGAHNIDYVIADRMLIPDSAQADYSEKVLYLPHCFQVNDSQRRGSDHTPSKASLDLPPDAFVFCSFCNTYKITPEVFNHWMRILHAVPSSVLVLPTHSDIAKNNLLQAAQARGIAPERLVFVDRVNTLDYLARYRVFDLFLDTFPYNAGSTASDVLRMGLPLLTRAGETMTSRMAASLLHTLGLDDLIAQSWAAYEARAIELATNRIHYANMKQRLLTAQETSPLFDTLQTTRAIERGYRMALDRHWQGLAPDHLYVSA